MKSLSKQPAVAANTELVPGRYPDMKDMGLQRKAIIQLIDEYDLSPPQIDGLFIQPAEMLNVEEETNVFNYEELYQDLGIRPSAATTMYAGGASYAIMLHYAALLVDFGYAKSILCVGASTFPSIGGGGERIAERNVHQEFEWPYGVFVPGLYSFAARRHMHEYGTTKKDFAEVAVSSREWALTNPNAKFYDEGSLTVEEVLDSPKVTDVYHRLHCSVPTEGGGAFLVTTGDLARQINDQPAYIKGIGEKHVHGHISQAPSYTTLAWDSSRKAFEMAGLSPRGIDVVQIYDAFANTPLACLEDMGFAEKGEGARLFTEGRTRPGGNLPVNTNGGLMSYGHVGTASGMSVLNEGITQTFDRAGERQVQDLDYSLIHTYGGMMCSHCTTILGREP